MSGFTRPRGTRDFTPEEMAQRRRCEALMRDTLRSFGYEEVGTPTFEHSELFIAKSGPQILDQLYDFKDKGGRDLVLRPELTAPVMRMYYSDLKSRPKPLRVQYFGNCFRYERPQKGRFREFWQMGVEYIGKRTGAANAEVINAAAASLDAVGSKDHVIRIGHVSILGSILERWGLKGDRDLMIAIDKKDIRAIKEKLDEREGKDLLIDMIAVPVDREEASNVLKDLVRSFPEMGDGPARELQEVMDLVRSKMGSVKMDISISRGLDYYDGLVFEIDAPSLGAEKQICGGGAYSLSSVFGSDVEGIGFGLGFDRIMASLEEGSLGGDIEKRIYLLPMGRDQIEQGTKISSRIRRAGVTCIMETSPRPLKKAIHYALSQGCTHLALLGEDEVRRDGLSLKDLHAKEQEFVPLDMLEDKITMDPNQTSGI
ncbi:MAG: histidine--tRNA ligase [Thermoplasmatota archaeon]